MNCGGLLMGTAKAREHQSPTLAQVGQIGESLIRLNNQSWMDLGFLS